MGDKSSNSNDNNIKEKRKDDSDFIFLKFVDQKEETTHLKVSRTAKLAKAFTKYCDHHGLQIGTPRFFLKDGTRLRPYFTPIDLQLLPGAEIHVFTEMTGGGVFI